MKKLLALVLTALLAFTVVGCGDKNEKKSTDGSGTQVAEEKKNDGVNDNTENTQTPSSDIAPDGSTEDSNELSSDSTNGEEQQNDETASGDDSDSENESSTGTIMSSIGVALPQIKEQTVIDTSLCSVVITGIKDDEFFGPTLMVDLENKSKDTDYVFSIKDSYIESVYTPMYLYSEVPAGGKSSEEISLSLSDLQKYGLTEITDIELSIEVKDSNASWIDPPAVLETVNIQPKGKKAVKKFTIGDDYIQNVYIDNKHAKVSALSYYQSDIYGYCIDLFIENRTNGNISVKFEDTTVNGKLLDPYVYEVINKGKTVIARVDWPASDFANNGITTFEEIKFTLVVANNDDVSGKSYSSDEIVLTFG